ncbi:MAG: hypothetical protein WCA92_00385 [Terriglobales bacterium]|jgi:hypothetical protein
MTSETRTFIEAKDIAGIEMECQQCRSTVFYPIAALEEAKKIIANCPQCNHGLFDVATTNPQSAYIQYPSYPAINDLQKIASGLRSLVRERTDIHANVRFRIDTELRGK